MVDDSALVSVIIPVCNVEKYLTQALDSVIGQTYKNLEIICLNDGSKDTSLQIMQDFAAKDDRIKIIDKPNEGYGRTCNKGIDAANGKWIVILEPDDWIDPNMIEEMVGFAEGFSEAPDIVKTPWINVMNWNDPDAQYEEVSPLYRRLSTSKKPFKLSEHPILIELHPSIWSAIYRKEFLDDNSIRFPEYPGAGWADNPFLIDTLCKADKIVYLDKPFYHYRHDIPGSTRNHQSDAAVALPFERWLVMMDMIEDMGIADEGILLSHYLRGFNYINGAIYDDGWDNPIVSDLTHKVLSRMDERIVLNSPKVSKERKDLFARMTGSKMQPNNSGRNLALAKEAMYALRTYGPSKLMTKMKSAFQQRKRLNSAQD